MAASAVGSYNSSRVQPHLVRYPVKEKKSIKGNLQISQATAMECTVNIQCAIALATSRGL